MRVHDRAICLKVTDYSETSQIAHMLARDYGVVHLMAKGTKRPKSKTGGALDLLAEGPVVFSDSGRGGLATLIEFVNEMPRGPLRRSAGRLNAALYMIEMVAGLLAEADPHPEVFELLRKGLARLEQPDAPVPAVLAYFQWRLLAMVGLLGELDRCVSCHRPAGRTPRQGVDSWFSSNEGGLLCPDCEGAFGEKVSVPPAARAGLSALADAAIGRRTPLPDEQAHAVNRLLAYHLAHQLRHPPRMGRYVIP